MATAPAKTDTKKTATKAATKTATKSKPAKETATKSTPAKSTATKSTAAKSATKTASKTSASKTNADKGDSKIAAKTATKTTPKSTAKKSSAADSKSNTTTNHDEIRAWVEQRGGKPAMVKGTSKKKSDAGILRIDFPGYSGEDTLQEIGWDEFFQKFDEGNLQFLHQTETADGKESRFNKFVSK